MNSFFDNLTFSLPTAMCAKVRNMSYEEYVFEEKILKHKDDARKLAQYVAEYRKHTEEPLSSSVKSILKNNKVMRSGDMIVYYNNDKKEYRGFNFQ